MIKDWEFARGGAWRNPKPTGGPYVCEQCRLDACGGNDATLTMQAVTTIELAPTDVCTDCGARLLEERVWPPFFHWEDPSLAGDGLVEQAEEGSSNL